MSRFVVTMPEQGPAQQSEAAAPQGRFVVTMPKAEPATPAQRVLASAPVRALQGARDVVDAGAQYLPWALGALTGGFGMAPNRVSQLFFDESDRVSDMITQGEQAYQDARRATGQSGMDLARLGGNVGGQALIAAAAGGTSTLPATTAGRAAFGAAMGGASAAATPVVGADSETLGKQKGAQALVGAASGAVATPVIGKITDALGKSVDRIGNALANRFRTRQVNEAAIADRLRFELARENVRFDQIPEQIRRRVVRDVAQALREGEQLDGVALLRRIDFDELGATPTRGTVTRDPTQWTREFNLRQVEGAGEPLVNIARDNRQALGRVFRDLGSEAADDAHPAGQRLMGMLQDYDRPVRAAVDASYQEARDEAGRYAGMNVAQFSRLANDALDEGQLGAALPGPAMTILNRLSRGEIPLNVNTYTQIRQTLQGMSADMRRQGNSQGALAVRRIVDALDNTEIDSAAGEAAKRSFELARKAAAFRFGRHEAIPALKAVIDGSADPDRFVEKFVLGATAKEMGELSRSLPRGGRDLVRSQIAQRLERAAFGSNVTGDAPMAVERYMSTLDRFGRSKLGHFFSPEEIDRLYRAGRVGAYMGTAPSGASPNRSGTAAALMNLLGRAKGAGLALPVIRQVADQSAVSRALAANPTTDPLPVLSPALRDLLPLVPIGAGAVSANP